MIGNQKQAAKPLGLSPLQQVSGVEINPSETRLTRMRRSVRWAAQCFSSWGFGWIAMVTLTYAPGVEWSPKHISRFTKHLMDFSRAHGGVARFCWTSELQERGALHYHVLVFMPLGRKLPKPDEGGWWPHGMSNIKAVSSPVGYVTKYASKLSQKMGQFPKGARMFGVGGIPHEDRELKTHSFLPQWIRNETCPEMRMRRAPGGGFFSKLTGEMFLSPWIVVRKFFTPGKGITIIAVKRELQPC